MIKWFKNQIVDCLKLLKAIPSLTLMLFVVSVIVTNLMAAKFIVSTSFIQVTGGLLLSWLPFLCMDITAKYFGPLASVKLNLFGLIMYLCCVLIFQIVVQIQYTPAMGQADYQAFNTIYAAQWKILLSSSIAYVASGIANALIHYLLTPLFKNNPDGKAAYYTKSYLSTFFGQFVDNFIFVGLLNTLIVGLSWPLRPVFGAAFIGGILELVTQVLFSVWGYKVLLRWKKEGVGKSYFESRTS